MSYPYDHPLLGRVDTGDAVDSEAPDRADTRAELEDLEHLIAWFDRMAADQLRSRRYRRRTNVGTSGFRRKQRRAVIA